jgi:predicted metal-dependent phosphoesterase TrpH
MAKLQNSFNKPVDLHLHSNFSDGLYSPSEVIKLAASCGLAAAALTDHDTVEGLDEALQAGLEYRIEVVPGVEISTEYNGREFHILGYYPDDISKLQAALAEIRRERYARMKDMLQKLASLGFKLEEGELQEIAGRAAPGRLHLARLMLKKGYVASIEQAFSLYLKKGRPAYAGRKLMQMAEGIDLLRLCGAVPVLAHPGELARPHLDRIVSMGIMGIEVYHPDHNAALQSFYHYHAEKKGLLITGGSDFHGDRYPGAALPGTAAVPYRCLALLKKAGYSNYFFPGITC